MGKNVVGGNSWFNVVKKAFMSPTKSSKRREEHDQEDDELKRGKRRWIFSKPCVQETTIQHYASVNCATETCSSNNSAVNHKLQCDDYERRAIALAMATRASAVGPVQAATEVIRLASPSTSDRKYSGAAIVIQTAYRGYLARRALRALRGIVKLQALVRGHNVRKQAKMTLRCIQTIVRVQTRARDQRRRLSYEGTKDSKFSVSNSLREYYDATRISQSREGSNVTDEWDCHQHTLEEIKAMLQKTKEAASKRENALSADFSRQMWRSENEEEKCAWSDHWETKGRNSSYRRDHITPVEIDNAQSYSVQSSRGSQNQQQHYPDSESVCSPIHRTDRTLISPFLVTPFQSKTKRLQVHSASPRCLKDNKNFMMAQTPTLGLSYHQMLGNEYGIASSVPNYMAATASAKARSRSESAPRQRHPERHNLSSAKKRLSFPAPEPDACAFMSDTELETRSKSPSAGYALQFEMPRRSNTLLQRQPW